MKVLITDFPGMGKTAITQKLKRRGHVAYDPEAMRGWFDALTLDDLLLEQRIRERTIKGPANQPTQLADVLMLHRQFEASLIARGALRLDVQPAVPELVNRILLICYGR